jgi:hypothetical protein
MSCSQYEYASPLPGTLEVRLGVKNSRADLIPFSATNRFNVVVRSFFVEREDGAFLELLSDLQAIRRKTDGDSLNCLSLAARDSQLVVGITYAPPGRYVGIAEGIKSGSVSHDPFVFLLSGIVPTIIEVRNRSTDAPFTPSQPIPSVTVNEGKTTIVTLTLDLDSSMPRNSEWFDWVAPYVVVSSVQNL